MPLTEKGREIMRAMKEQYGEEQGERVFYASKNAGKISGVDEAPESGTGSSIASLAQLNAANRKLWGSR
jgi:hypothetical protein